MNGWTAHLQPTHADGGGGRLLNVLSKPVADRNKTRVKGFRLDVTGERRVQDVQVQGSGPRSKARRFEREKGDGSLSFVFIGQNATRTPIPDHCCERTRHERRAARAAASHADHVLRRCSMCATRTHSSDLRSSTPPRVAASSCALPLVMSMASCTSSQKSFQAMLSR